MTAPTPEWRAELLADAEHVKAFVADPRVRGLADGVLALLDALDAAEAERDAARADAARLNEALRVALTVIERSTQAYADDRRRVQDFVKPMIFDALSAHDAEVQRHA